MAPVGPTDGADQIAGAAEANTLQALVANDTVNGQAGGTNGVGLAWPPMTRCRPDPIDTALSKPLTSGAKVRSALTHSVVHTRIRRPDG